MNVIFMYKLYFISESIIEKSRQPWQDTMPGITLQEVGGSLVIDVPEEKDGTTIGRGPFLQVLFLFHS